LTDASAGGITTSGRRPRGAVRDGLVSAGLELARTGGPDAVVLREVARMVCVVPNAAYRHFADREEFIAEKEHLCASPHLDHESGRV